MEWEELREGVECEIRPINDKTFEESGWQKSTLRYNTGFYTPNGGLYNIKPYWYGYYRVPWKKFKEDLTEGDLIEDFYYPTIVIISNLKQIKNEGKFLL